MSVILKQRTWRTEDGLAVGEGDSNARILVGPKGATVSDDVARALKLKDGKLPGQTVGQGVGGDDTIPDGQSKRKEKIADTMLSMVIEAKESDSKSNSLFTSKGLPDGRVLSTRLGFQVKGDERDEIWATVEKTLEV